MKRLICTFALVGLLTNGAFAGDGCGSQKVSARGPVIADLAETAIAAGKFQTLVAAAQAAGLVDALKGSQPLTIFAPTDKAFGKLPAGTVESLLKPENRETLRSILAYHVVPGRYPASKVLGSGGAVTLNGQRVGFQANDHGVTVGNARVLKTDIYATNGVIHVIDRVLMPASKNLVETAQGAGQFDTLLAAAKAAGLVPALTGKGPFTVFAPTDKAFAQLPQGTVESLLRPENREQLATILKYHVVPGRVYSESVLNLTSADTLASTPVDIRVDDRGIFVSGARVTQADINTSNGVIHIIDAVMIPKTKPEHASR